jgi:hypothetical protein
LGICAKEINKILFKNATWGMKKKDIEGLQI